MPLNGKVWAKVTDMVVRNHRLLVFTNIASKEADEGIAYQWRYTVENEHKFLCKHRCQNIRGNRSLVRKRGLNFSKLNPSLSKMLDERCYNQPFLLNYFPTIPVQNEACKEHSGGLGEMVNTCYKASGNVLPNFLAINFYMRSDGRGVSDIQDTINGLNLCGCKTITACQDGAPFGVCKNVNRHQRRHLFWNHRIVRIGSKNPLVLAPLVETASHIADDCIVIVVSSLTTS